MSKIRIRRGNPRHPEVSALLEASQALLRTLFPAEENFFLEIDALREPEIRFFTAEENGRVVATGALAARPGYGEVKSMYTCEAARGRGAARKLLEQIEAEARAMGLPYLRLETGDALAAALKLYERAGFARRGPFGDYPASPTSIFMEKPLG